MKVLKKISYSGNFHQKVVACSMLIICILGGCQNDIVSKNVQLSTAEGLIWTMPDSSLCILSSLDPVSLPYEEQIYWQLVYNHACLRLGIETDIDSVMPEILQFYEKHNNQEYLAKSYFVQGLAYYYQTDYYDAMSAIKEAESRLAYISDTLPFAALTYHLLGAISETDELTQIANMYYRQGLEYARILNDEFRLACFYRDIARTETNNDSTAESYYLMAMQHAENIGNPLLYYDILIQMESHREDIDSTRLYELCMYMNDTLQQARYTGFTIEYLLSQHKINEAEKMLTAFAADTALYTTIAERYQYYESQIKATKGYTQDAYTQLAELYLDLCEQIKQDAKSRTYTISRMYDVELEKNRNLRLTIRQQQLWITIGTVSVLLIVALALCWILYSVEHTKRIIGEQQQQIDRLHAKEIETELQYSRIEMAEKRKSLYRLLQQRIMLTKQLHKHTEDIKEMHAELIDIIQDLSFANKKNWEQFLDEFNQLYGNLLHDLQTENPSINKQDEEYLALTILGLTPSEIAAILHLNPQSVWNRRQRIRSHIEDETFDLDSWIDNVRGFQSGSQDS